jgi:hypothetical protein
VREQLPSSATISAELPAATVDAVRAAVSGLMRAPEGASGPLYAAVRTLAREARDNAVPPERLLVSFKVIWASETGEHPMPDRRVETDWLDQMVSYCIKEYFA